MSQTPQQTRLPRIALLSMLTLLLTAGAAVAQSGDRDGHGKHDRDVQLGLGIGLVDAEDAPESDIYYSASLRFRIGQSNEAPVWDGDNYRGRPPADSGIRGYLEPEVSYWSVSGNDSEDTDLLAGLNLIGVVPTRNADFFFGVGFGFHFFDSDVTETVGGQRVRVQTDDERLGGNLQAGVDVNLSESTALFGVGRLDILEGDRAERQTKIYGGLRIKF